jgi:hypothetical protein
VSSEDYERELIRRLFRWLRDWLFPIRCSGKYRFHCYHRDVRKIAIADPACLRVTSYFEFYRKCCRCGRETGHEGF